MKNVSSLKMPEMIFAVFSRVFKFCEEVWKKTKREKISTLNFKDLEREKKNFRIIPSQYNRLRTVILLQVTRDR